MAPEKFYIYFLALDIKNVADCEIKTLKLALIWCNYWTLGIEYNTNKQLTSYLLLGSGRFFNVVL